MNSSSINNELPSDLFEALANNDIEGIIYLYASSSRIALQSIARLNGFRSLHDSSKVSGKKDHYVTTAGVSLMAACNST
jgi:hypothetical protein